MTPTDWRSDQWKRLTGGQQQQWWRWWRMERAECWTIFRGVMWADSVPQGWWSGWRVEVAAGIPGVIEARAQLGILGEIFHSFSLFSVRDESNEPFVWTEHTPPGVTLQALVLTYTKVPHELVCWRDIEPGLSVGRACSDKDVETGEKGREKDRQEAEVKV